MIRKGESPQKDDEMIPKETVSVDTSGEQPEQSISDTDSTAKVEGREVDSETEKELATITEVDKLLTEGANKDNPEKIIEALEIIENAPDTVITVRQRDDNKVAALKTALKNVIAEISNLDNWLPPETRKRLGDLGSDVVKACRILWNRGDKSLFSELTTISKHFYKTHGLGRLIAMLKGEKPPQTKLE